MAIVNDSNPRDAATLTGGTTVTTLAIGCWNARQVTFLLSATNGIIPTSIEPQCSNDNINWWDATSNPSLAELGVLVTGLSGNAPLNAGEIPVIIMPTVGVTLMAVSYVRLKIVAAADDTTGLMVRAAVITDNSAGLSTQAVL